MKDFRNLDYDAIAEACPISATRDDERRNTDVSTSRSTRCYSTNCLSNTDASPRLKKEEQSQLTALRNENAKLRAENTANAKRLATLETRDKEREARLTRLEISMPAARPVANTIASNKTGSSNMKHT